MDVLFSSTVYKRVLFKNQCMHHYRVEKGLTFSEIIPAGNFITFSEGRKLKKNFQKRKLLLHCEIQILNLLVGTIDYYPKNILSL